MKPTDPHKLIDYYKRSWQGVPGLADVLHQLAGNKEQADKAADLLPTERSFRVEGAEVEKRDKSEFESYFKPESGEPATVPLVKPKGNKSE